jgi:flagellar hook-associated protein 3 FlgL
VNTRITTSMVQRNVLADLNSVSAKLTRLQMKSASGKEISRPSDDPFHASQAMALRQSLEATRQHQRNVQDAMGWADMTEDGLDDITQNATMARDLLVQAGSDTTDPTARKAIAAEMEQLIEAIKQGAAKSYRGSYVFAGADTSARPYASGAADDTYHGDEGGFDPAIAGIVREIGPGVTMTINTIGRDVLGDGQTANDNKLLHVLRDAVDHLNAGDGPSLRADLSRLDTNLDHILEVRAANGARAQRLETALSRLQQTEESTLGQLSDTEDADIAKTLIELNSQTAAYQAALRAGANLVQSSLMDFLR